MMTSIEEIEAWVGQGLPGSYRAFLALTPDGFLVGDTLVYGRSDFIERNETYEIKEYCPGFITIGDDSGGQQVVLSLCDGRVAIVDAGAMTPDCFCPLAQSFGDWRSGGFRCSELP